MENENSNMTERKNLFARIADFTASRFELRVWIEAGVSVALFFYYWLIIHPEYIQFARQPVFFLEKGFFLGQLQMPGGIVDYIAAFLTESFQFGMLGAALLTILTVIFYILLKILLRPGAWWIAPVIPTILLAAVQTDPNYSIVQTLAFIIAMAAFLLCRSILFDKKWIGLGLVVLLLAFVYFVSPYAMIILTLLCVLYGIFDRNHPLIFRVLFPVAYIVATLIIPWIAQGKIFFMSGSDAFLRHSPLWVSDTSDIPALGKVYPEVILALAVLASAGILFYGMHRLEEKKPSLRWNLVQFGVAAVILVASMWQVVGKSEREFLAIRYTAHVGQWDQTLSFVNPETRTDLLNLFHIVRAYYHTGGMSEEFLLLKQNGSGQNLFLKSDICYEYPLDYSDFQYELGNINESKHWGFEALTHYGESEDVLKRLALTHILEGNFAAAQEFLSRLQQNPFSSSWASHYLDCINNPSKLRDEYDLQRLHAYMPKSDFIINENRHEGDLRAMLSLFPRNEMAYQYLLMNDLLNREVNLFTNDFLQLKINQATPMPRLYEEALVAFLSSNPSMDSVAARIGIRKETVDRFKTFYGFIAAHHGDVASTYDELNRNYGDTYWFYLLRAVPSK
jgi:hypothetical protein